MDRWMLWLPVEFLAMLERGGPILWLILSLSCLMWTLILVCYLNLWSAHRMASHTTCLGHITVISAMVQVLPMLGLLGSVEGMIDVFHVIALYGSGNMRGIAGGISIALITTMAGLVTSLSGVYFVSDLKHRLVGSSPYQESG